jgi:hypothetical protein
VVGLGALGAVWALVMAAGGTRVKPLDQEELLTLRKQEKALLGRYDQVSKDKGTFQIPVQDAMDLVLKNPAYLRATDPADELIDRNGYGPRLVARGKGAQLMYRRAPEGSVQLVTLDDKAVATAVDQSKMSADDKAALAAAFDAPPTKRNIGAEFKDPGTLTVSLAAKKDVEWVLRTFPADDVAPAAEGGAQTAVAVLDDDTVLACVTMRSQGLVCTSRYGGAVRLLDPALQGAALEAAVAQHKARSAKATDEVLKLRASRAVVPTPPKTTSPP